MTVCLFDTSSDKPILIRSMGYTEKLPLALTQLREVVPEGIAFVDEYGVICHANKRLAGLTSYSPDELVGQTVEVIAQSRCRDTHVVLGNEFARDPIPRAPVMAGHAARGAGWNPVLMLPSVSSRRST